MSLRKKLNEIIFSKWTPQMAYLLGQFKAGANFSINKNSQNQPVGHFYGITINTTNLQHLIKLQLLLSSDHRIAYDNSNQRRHGGRARMRFMFNVKNQYMLDDLKRYGFNSVGPNSPKVNAPFPCDIPKDLTPHFIRGYFDERCTVLKSKNRPTLNISGQTKEFLSKVADVICDELGISSRTVYQKAGSRKGKAKSYFIVYTGAEQVTKIYKYLYLFVPASLYCVEKYHKFCQALNSDESYENIDVNLDVKSLYLLHEYCCEKSIDPNILIQNNLGAFLSYAKEHELFPKEKAELIEEGKKVALNFNYGNEKTDWEKTFAKLYIQ